MRIELQNGICGFRFRCDNLDKTGCNVFPKSGEEFVECKMFKLRR